MIAWLLALWRPGRRQQFYPEQIEAHLREVGLSPFAAEKLQDAG